MMTDAAEHASERSASSVKFLSGRVAIVQWRGYWFTVSQIRWGRFRRWLYARVYRHECPPREVRFETAVFLSNQLGRFNPQKPLHATFQTSRREAREVINRLVEEVAAGRLLFQTFFQK